MKKAILRQIQSNHTRIRTKEVTGDLFYDPEVGSSVILFSESLDKMEGNTRIVSTSPVKELTVVKQDLYLITTRNSTYELEILQEPVNE